VCISKKNRGSFRACYFLFFSFSSLCRRTLPIGCCLTTPRITKTLKSSTLFLVSTILGPTLLKLFLTRTWKVGRCDFYCIFFFTFIFVHRFFSYLARLLLLCVALSFLHHFIFFLPLIPSHQIWILEPILGACLWHPQGQR